MQRGWVKVYRKLLTSPMYRQLSSKQRDVMITLLLLANHESNTWEFKGEIYDVKPGQFITSLESIKENCASDVSIQNIRTALSKLEKHGFLTNQSTNRNRLITIVNWGVYQSSTEQPNKQTNRQLTSNQQATNKQLTTNKNDKELKNEKNNIYMAFESHDNPFLKIYNHYFYQKFNRQHMRVTEEQLEFILKHIEDLQLNDISEEEFEEAVVEYLDNLPKKNNGNIIAFIHVFPRYFGYF